MASMQDWIQDRQDSYGWISIGLHWVSAVIFFAMWFLGKSIEMQPTLHEFDGRRDLHVTLGLAMWLVLAGRIVWRLVMSHPRVRGQSLRIHRFARMVHYAILLALVIMLLSGPALAWLLPGQSAAVVLLRAVHESSAGILFALVVLHIFGALKHLMFHDDETIARMLWPRRRHGIACRQPDA